MAQWAFEEVDPRYVEQDPTQRDQFNNDDVSLAEAIVREVIQNSTDAAIGSQPVSVRFAISMIGSSNQAHFRALFSGLTPHLDACNIDAGNTLAKQPRILVVEDFGTNGLTGDVAARDGKNFHSFWRRHGRSGKSGRQGGRWGLGKLVYSSSSDIRCFFGLTVRVGEIAPLLMGQAVLQSHEIGTQQFVAHGFWFGERSADGMQLPVSEFIEVSAFARLSGLTRTTESGLSLVIPFVNSGITEDVLIHGVVKNYYFPILAGKLIVEVGSTRIDAKSFPEVAKKVLKAANEQPDWFTFVSDVSARLNAEPKYQAKLAAQNQKVSAALFDPDQIIEMKNAFGRGEIVHICMPVRLRRKSGEEKLSSVQLFLKSPPENAKAFALFARGSITVPAEQKFFAGAHAYGAFVGIEEDVVAFLGDAENPAHTGWNGSADKFATNWRSPGQTLKFLRYALAGVYELVSEEGERDDPDALIDFFALTDLARSFGGKKKRLPIIPPNIEASEKAFRILKNGAGGFAIVPGPGAAKWSFPKSLRVRVAYDMIGSNPFSKHSPFDFDLAAGKIQMENDNVSIDAPQPNVLQLTIRSAEFRFAASGFDANRDLLVDARVRS